jgi:hypothetical protein
MSSKGPFTIHTYDGFFGKAFAFGGKRTFSTLPLPSIIHDRLALFSNWIDCSSNPISAQENSQQIFSPSGIKTSKFSHIKSPESCSLDWATDIHETVTCPLAFPPPPYDKDTRPLPDLSGKWYSEVKKDKTLEKVLAMGGLRLAYILNNVLGDPEEMKHLGDDRGGIYNLV